MKLSPALDVNVALETSDTVTLLLDLEAPAAPAPDVPRSPSTLQVVLNHSGPDGRRPLETATQTLIALVQRLNPPPASGVVAFDDEAPEEPLLGAIKMSYTQTTGDLLTLGLPAIGHGCNTRGSMAGGIARQVESRWPTVYAEYDAACRAGTFRLGSFQCVDVGGMVVYNLATQVDPGRDARIDAISSAVRGALHHAAELGDRPVRGTQAWRGHRRAGVERGQGGPGRTRPADAG